MKKTLAPGPNSASSLPSAQGPYVPQVSFRARYWLRGALIARAMLVIHSRLVANAAISVVLIFCRPTQNIRAKGRKP